MINGLSPVKVKAEKSRVWQSVLFVVLFYAILFIKVLSSHQWDPLAFVLLTPDNLPAGQTWGVGYDGRFSYHIAVNPLGSTEGLDEPNYRYQRILYPLLVKLFSFGVKGLVPWVMLAINLISSGMLCYFLGLSLLRRKVSPWYVLVLIFSLGYLLAMRMDLLEPMALALALAGWLMYEESKPGVAILFFVLSGLTKEIGLVFPFAIAAWELLNRNPRRALILLGCSLLPYLILRLYLSDRFGIPEMAIEKSALTLIPYWGISYLEGIPSKVLVVLWSVGPSIAFGLWAAWEILRRKVRNIENPDVILVLAQALLIAVLPIPTWKDPLAIFRFNLGLIVAVLLCLARSHPKALPFAAGLWLSSGLVLLLIPGMF